VPPWRPLAAGHLCTPLPEPRWPDRASKPVNAPSEMANTASTGNNR
jgi:hypothetical protein